MSVCPVLLFLKYLMIMIISFLFFYIFKRKHKAYLFYHVTSGLLTNSKISKLALSVGMLEMGS